MLTLDLDASKREATGKGAARKVRSAGNVPGILYGTEGTTPLSMGGRDLALKLRNVPTGNTLVDLKIDGAGASKVLIKEVQRDPISGDILHVDFNKVDMDQTVNVKVPIKLIGSSAGVKLGGAMTLTIRQVPVVCKVKDIPESIDIDVTEMQVGDFVYANELSAGDFKILTPGELAVCAVYGKKASADDDGEEEESTEVAAT